MIVFFYRESLIELHERVFASGHFLKLTMVAPRYDEEQHAASVSTLEAMQAAKKMTSLRQWGPALIAVALVVAINSALFRHGTQELSAGAQRRLHLAGERALAVQNSMKARGFTISKSKGMLGERDLSEEDGGVVMEYTRRRHRYLGNHVHIDVSAEFSHFGKISTSLIYFAFWVLSMFPDWVRPIERPVIALGGGLSMIVWRYILVVVDHAPRFDAESVIFMEPLFLLFGLMLVTVSIEKMERGGLFGKLRDFLDDPVNWKRSVKIMAVSTVGSAAVMNVSVVLLFSAVIVDLCVRHKVTNSMPYLLSLATAANIGSALTVTGNAQNSLIVPVAYDTFGWLEFVSNMILPVVAATIINSTMMLIYYRSELFPGSSGLAEIFGVIFLGKRTREMLAQEQTCNSRQANNEEAKVGWSVWSRAQLFVVFLFLLCFAAGLDVYVVSICAGAILMVLTLCKRQHYNDGPKPSTVQYDDDDGNPLLLREICDMDGNKIDPEQQEEEELVIESETTFTKIDVDYGLLMLFIGQFLLVGSFDDTGVPQGFFNYTLGNCANQMTEGACVYWFVMIVTLLSNVVSNVPTCQMFAATFQYASPYEWLQLSLSATIAGNLTMLGSVSNMIVAFQAAKAGDHTFTSGRYAPFGIPSAILCLYAGTFLLATVHFAPECSERLGECS